MTVRRDRPAEPPWYELSGDQRALLAPLREFLRAEVAPGAAARDRDGGFPHELVGQLGALGVMGMQVPERYGGSGLDTATVALILEEIAAVDGSLCLTVASHNSLCIGHLLKAGDERQHAAWLPRLASGESLGAWCLTEYSETVRFRRVDDHGSSVTLVCSHLRRRQRRLCHGFGVPMSDGESGPQKLMSSSILGRATRCFNDRPHTLDPATSKDTWARTLAFFGQRLWHPVLPRG